MKLYFLRSPLFLICLLVFILHQVSQYIFKIPLPFLNNYLDNFLAMPVILSLLLAEKKYIYKQKDQKLSLIFVIIATLYIALVTEWLFPFLSERFTTDCYDLVFYSLGSVFYCFFMNKIPVKEEN
ncbi:MAG: hypothetical protein ACR2KB_18225 [Chitinophagaceae bacterium]